MSTFNSNDIAIISMSMRFPKASDLHEYWDMLLHRKSGISLFSEEELNALGVAPEKTRNSKFVNAGAVVEQPYHWDADFFGYSPKAASLTDPQQRLLLECAWELMEKGGYSPLNTTLPTGVFLSVAANNYAHRYRASAGQSDDYIAFTSNDADFASTRISYHLNLKGPSMTVETACSSSLVAVHMACESLLNYETDMAICGGGSLLFPQAGYMYDPNLIFSPDGKCRPFDKEAKGTVFGNGIGLILVKRLKDAVESRDTILAVIKGSAVNNDGRSKNSFYSPSPEGQKKVIKEALTVSQVSPETIGFIEAHGTATPIGDPIEVEALTEVFRDYTSHNRFCYIGSVKSNLGHLNKAAGIAGLMKAVLALKNKVIPATLNFSATNPEIDFEDSPFVVNAEAVEWKENAHPRRAGVSSFGVGGTNAHIILEEPPRVNRKSPVKKSYVLPVSAKSEEYLSMYKLELAKYLREQTSLSLEDIEFTLQESRSGYAFRELAVCSSKDEFIAWLQGSTSESRQAEEEQDGVVKRWLGGDAIDWSLLRKDSSGARVSLPSHPMKRSSFRIDDYMPKEEGKGYRLLPLIEENISTFRKQMFRTNFSRSEYLLQEHNYILPAAAYIEMIAEGLKLSGEDQFSYGLKDVVWKQAFSLHEQDQRPVFMVLGHTGEKIRFYFSSDEDNDHRSIAEGELVVLKNRNASFRPSLSDMTGLLNAPSLGGKEIYSIFQNSGFRYGEHFQLIKNVFRKENKALALVNLSYSSPDKSSFIFDPLLIDAAFQTAVSLLPSFDTALELFVPYQLKEARFYKLPGEKVKIYTHRLTEGNASSAVERFNIYVLDQDESVCMEFLNFELVQWNRSNSVKSKSTEGTDSITDEALLEEISNLLLKVIAGELGHSLSSLNTEESFESLGLDSVILVNVINNLDKNFPGLPKTLFFEYPNIAEAGRYLIENYAEACMSLSGRRVTETASAASYVSFNQTPQVKVMESREKQSQPQPDRDNDIAVIGVHGMYPESGSLEAFWENLKSGKDCIREIPADRWNIDGFYDPDINKQTTSFTKWGGFLDKIEYFDPIFFKIAPKEAAFIDPQERLFLESAWCCVENAGYTPKNVCSDERKVGVYAGVMWGHYQLFAMEEFQRGEIVVNTSNYWSIPNRVSFTMNFNGPSMAVDTACSSSLSAIHLACQSIINGESDLAIAGGVNLNLHPYKHYILSARRFAATDGRCRSFGEGGSGYVPGEGVGTVLLKPLKKAIEDKDFIHAVIKGSAINHGGKVSGFTVPNSNAQAAVVKTAFAQAGISPLDISYIEAHGTGTSLGDPIEINGLARAYAGSSEKKEYCPIGSVKSNIGHLESAAGVASIHKVILQLNHKTLVPSIHGDPVNPYIDFANSPFKVQKKLEEWKVSEHYSKRLAGISSFGAGGANAHVVVEEAAGYRVPVTAPENEPGETVIVLSAQDDKTLNYYAREMSKHLANPGYASLSLNPLAYTLQTGRLPLEYRLAFTASSMKEVRDKFDAYLAGDRSNVHVGKTDKTVALPPKDYVAGLIQRKEYAELARAWATGATVDWEMLWGHRAPGRIPLPYYPFNKRRLWYRNLEPGEPLARILGQNGNQGKNDSQPVKETASPVNGLSARKEQVVSHTVKQEVFADMPGVAVNYFVPELKAVPLVPDYSMRQSQLVLLSQSQEDYDALRKYYSQETIWVRAGASFRREDSGYSIPFLKADTYSSLYNELSGRIQLPEIDILINAGALFAPDFNLFTDFFRHVKQLGDTFKKQKINVLVFWSSRNMNEAAYKALGSFAKVASKENSRLNIRVVEFRKPSPVAGYSSALISELNSRAPFKREVVYSENDRYEYCISRIDSRTTIPSGISIQREGVYLITGGMGAIGLNMAQWLVSKGAGMVILSGRKPLESLSAEQKDRLNSSGGKMSYLAADIADPASTQNLVSAILERYGKLNGIIHSAGVVDDKLLLKKSEESFISVISPKVKGALNLDRAVAGAQPDFIVYFSSVSAVAGQMGQADYSTANRFLDEYAAYRNTTSSVTYISVNWPYWNNGGMKLAQPYVDMMRKSGMDGITDREGVEVMENILKMPYRQVVIFKSNEAGSKGFFTDTHLEFQPAKSPVSSPTETIKQPAPPEISQRNVISDDAGSTQAVPEVKEIIVSILSEALGLSGDEIDTSASLEEYGVDSVAIMKVTSELEKLFPEISIALFFECKSVEDIVNKIHEELKAGALTYQGKASLKPATVTVSHAASVPVSAEEKKNSPNDIGREIKEKITSILSEVLGLHVNEIDTSSSLEEYGVDSVAIMKVTSELEKLFPELSIALFFECKTIDDITAKIQDELQNGALTYRGSSQPSVVQKPALPAQTVAVASAPEPASPAVQVNEVKDKVAAILAEVLGLSPDEIDPSVSLEEYGVDSVAIMKVTSELEKLFTGLSIALFFECKTIDDIAAKIEEELSNGNLTRSGIQEAVAMTTPAAESAKNTSVSAVSGMDLNREIKEKIVSILCEALGLTTEEIDTSSSLEDYGVDSVVIMKVAAELEKLFPELSIALFFECKSVDDIVFKINEELAAGTLTYAGAGKAMLAGYVVKVNEKTSEPESYYKVAGLSQEGNITKVPVHLDGRSPEVSDHVINGQVIFAGAGYLDLVKRITETSLKTTVNTFRNISWFSPLIIEGTSVAVDVDFVPKGDFRQYSFKASQKALAKGEVGYTALNDQFLTSPSQAISGYQHRISGAEVYQWFRNNKFDYGAAFQTIEELYVSEGKVTGRLKKPAHAASWISPMILDGVFQCIVGLTLKNPVQVNELWVPFFVEKMTFHSETVPDELWVSVIKDSYSKDATLQQFKIYLTDRSGKVFLDIHNFTLKSFGNSKSKTKPETGVKEEVNAEVKVSVASVPMTSFSNEPIAVIAASCKFPGADSPEEFWKNLAGEMDVVKEIPSERWDYRRSYDPVKGKKGKTYSRWGGFVNNIDAFDNEFFKIKESDAMCLDPQQRILLELTQHLFDKAGYSRNEVVNKNIAVIIGGSSGMWGQLIEDLADEMKRNVVVNTIQNMIAARISDFYDLKGTSLTMDTACSSSLVAIHEACQKIRSGECSMAIAGGITLLLADGGHIGFSQAEVLSPAGKCHVFDKNADGIVLGEGAGLVLLKSYRQAMKDGDQILAVIRGSAVNNDGKTMGITTPNMLMQKEVVKMALENSGIDKHTVTYLEAHGTGTLLGDPIEVKAATQVYGEGTTKKQYCAIASVKSNIGHLLHASGVASLIKVSMALQHKVLPASLNCKVPHPRFEFENSPFYPVTSTRRWDTDVTPRRAAISSFGFGGTNCHMILEETDPAYVPSRKSLPLTEFRRKRFWPGRPIMSVTSAVRQSPGKDSMESISYSEILEKLEKGLITVEQAIELEKSLK